MLGLMKNSLPLNPEQMNLINDSDQMRFMIPIFMDMYHKPHVRSDYTTD
jgi:hypothetical protein